MKSANRWLDISAISLSALCLVHCLGAGLFLAVVSALQVKSIWLGERFHAVIFVVALLVASVALGRGWQRYHVKTALIAGVSGLFLMGSALLPGLHHDSQTILTVIGALMLALAHCINMLVHIRT